MSSERTEHAALGDLDVGLSRWLLGGILYVHVIRATDLRTRPPWKFTMGSLTCALPP